MAENVITTYLTAKTLKLEAIRLADLFRVDWADNVFKSSGWTTKLKTVPENADTVGLYLTTADVSTWDDGDYIFSLTDTLITTRPVTERTVRVAAGLVVEVADVERWRALAPNVLVSGRVDGSVGAMVAGVVTAAAVATNAIDADALAADAVAEIQSGLATAAALATVQADTDDVQARLPAALVGGRMDSNAALVGDKTGYELSATGVASVWSATTRTLTSFGSLVADIATAVWGAATRTLTSFGTLAADVWASATRTLTASLDPTAAQIRAEIDANSTQLIAVRERTDRLPDDPADQSLVIAATDAIMGRLGVPATTVSGDIAAGRVVEDAIKAVTDQFAFSTPGLVDARAFVVDDKTGYQLLFAQGIARGVDRLFEFVMYDVATNPLPGVVVTSERSVDGGALAAMANSAVEVGTGIYKIVASAADLDGGCITFRFTAPGAAPTLLTVFTVEV